MAAATRTTNPLHFEDLEPHRFEDLVRQLIYGFRDWHALEATGRQGSDDGFDARGWELVSPRQTTNDEIENGDESEDGNSEASRVWLVQCKRERVISPKKLLTYLNALDANEISALHGLIFVAACDFSKKARDEFRGWCSGNRITEFFVWGKAELEDMLFQPQNDHLLFAYFGISLQIKKRSAKTKLRGTLATKRQVIRYLGGIEEFVREPVLLRDPDATSYPDPNEVADFDERPLWRVYHFVGHYYGGIKILIRTHYAYLDDDGASWDAEERVRTNLCLDDPWPKSVDNDLARRVRNFWDKVPEANRAKLEVIAHIPYDDILAIDEGGDELFPFPHIYVRLDRGGFSHGSELLRAGEREVSVKRENQIKHFLDVYSDPKE